MGQNHLSCDRTPNGLLLWALLLPDLTGFLGSQKILSRPRNGSSFFRDLCGKINGIPFGFSRHIVDRRPSILFFLSPYQIFLVDPTIVAKVS